MKQKQILKCLKDKTHQILHRTDSWCHDYIHLIDVNTGQMVEVLNQCQLDSLLSKGLLYQVKYEAEKACIIKWTTIEKRYYSYNYKSTR